MTDHEILKHVYGQLELALTDSTHNREYFRGVIFEVLEKLKPLLGNGSAIQAEIDELSNRQGGLTQEEYERLEELHTHFGRHR